MDATDCYNWEKPNPVLADAGVHLPTHTYDQGTKCTAHCSGSSSLHAEITGGFNFVLLYRFSNLSLISIFALLGEGLEVIAF